MSEQSKRSRQVSDLIRRELASLFKREIRDPRLANLSITGVDVSPDFSLARVYYTLLDKSELEDAKIALKKVPAYLRRLLAKNIKLRYTPQIKFIYDDSVIAAEALSDLINTVIAEDEFRESQFMKFDKDQNSEEKK